MQTFHTTLFGCMQVPPSPNFLSASLPLVEDPASDPATESVASLPACNQTDVALLLQFKASLDNGDEVCAHGGPAAHC